MIKEITKDTKVLTVPSKKVKYDDEHTKQLIIDLIDTANSLGTDKCVGLAAIQISDPSSVIIVFDGVKFIPYVNPVITKYIGDQYETEEGCVSMEGTSIVKRYRGVEIMHQKGNKFVKEKHFGFYAEIIQHEVDHLHGKLI